MTTARSFGNYDLAAALADLIDNSIHARARKIEIEFEPFLDDVVVRIRDDGCGMEEKTLIDAMKPASANPEDERDPHDLGRFGWGLKSASLSQARVLTVISWRGATKVGARWDIDNLGEWGMDLLDDHDADAQMSRGVTTESGTEVIWTSCDRLAGNGSGASLDEHLNEKIAHARRTLSLIFHRYLSGEGLSPLKIVLQGVELLPTDPFLTKHHATQSLGEERIFMGNGQEISVTPFVIPHFSKLTYQERDSLGGAEGMVRNQGFYVYRNKRLIISGTWFRLVPHGELSQLTRVRVDLPNSLDAQWKITLDKSDAELPAILRKRLREIVKKFSHRSMEAHRKRGISLDSNERAPVWERNAYQGRIRYLINRDHPLVQQLILEAEDPIIVRETLKLIESYVPVDRFAQELREAGTALVQSITDTEEYEALVHACFLACMRQQETIPTLHEFLAYAKRVEPFASQWKYTESFVREQAIKKWKLGE